VQIIFDGNTLPADFSLPGAVRLKREGPVVTAVIRAQREEEFDALKRRFPAARVQLFPLGLEELFIELLGPEAADMTAPEMEVV
jgi:hypothetical protein